MQIMTEMASHTLQGSVVGHSLCVRMELSLWPAYMGQPRMAGRRQCISLCRRTIRQKCDIADIQNNTMDDE